jgi:hypothetical protein
MGIGKILLILVVVLVVLALVGYFALKSYVLPTLINKYVNQSQLNSGVGALQVTQFTDSNPFANASSGLPSPP